MLTVKEVAERMGVCGPTVRAWIAGGLPHYRLGVNGKGRKMMVKLEDLEAWVESCRVEGGSPPSATKAKPRKEYKPQFINLDD
jgi:excisionase family DNA binding protein